jgi:hypothetical protein
VLFTKHYLGDIIKKDEMGETYGIYWERKSAYMGFVGKLGGKRSLGRPTLRWEDNIKMDF